MEIMFPLIVIISKVIKFDIMRLVLHHDLTALNTVAKSGDLIETGHVHHHFLSADALIKVLLFMFRQEPGLRKDPLIF
ncbi:MAG: hypothetical protein ACLTYJ_01640 [Merdibacter sp.]